jgi:hypothetical protein
MVVEAEQQSLQFALSSNTRNAPGETCSTIPLLTSKPSFVGHSRTPMRAGTSPIPECRGEARYAGVNKHATIPEAATGEELSISFTTTSFSEVDRWLDTVIQETLHADSEDASSASYDGSRLSTMDALMNHFRAHSLNSLSSVSRDINQEHLSSISGTSQKQLLQEPGEFASTSFSDSLSSVTSGSSAAFYNAYPQVSEHSLMAPVFVRTEAPRAPITMFDNYHGSPSKGSDFPCSRKQSFLGLIQSTCGDNSHMAVNTSDRGSEVATLSPNVTPHRKGMGPKRTRRPSYYDPDIIVGQMLRRQKDGIGSGQIVIGETGATSPGSIGSDMSP